MSLKTLHLFLALPALVAAGGHTGGSTSSASKEAGSGEDTSGYQQGAACYGFGGGHGVWKCGTSAAWCTEIGGVARYTEDYRSRRSGACMCETGCSDPKSIVPGFTKADSHDGKSCYNFDGKHSISCGMSKEDCEGLKGISYAAGYVSQRSGCCLCGENCDKTLETGKDCKYSDSVASPSPPPAVPPSPPPSPSFPPTLGDATTYETVKMQVNVTGTVEDFDEAKKSSIAANVGKAVGVHPDDITVTVAPGSVIITIEIKVPDAATALAVTATIDKDMKDTKGVGAVLNLGYRVSINEVMKPETVSVGGGMGTGVLIVIIVAALVVVVLVGLVAMKMMKKPAASVKIANEIK